MSDTTTYTTSVPLPTFGPNGFVAPSEQAILTGRLTDINAAFGGGLNMALETGQGQIASTETAIIGNANNQFLALANGVDPAFATGRLQDAIGRIYFMTREPAQPTTVACECIGGVGVVIPVGALASDGTYDYANSSAVTISSVGSVSASFTNTVTGPLPCAANSLIISQVIPGWDAITNSPGVLGNYVETSQAFELRRQNSVAISAVSVNDAVLANVLAVANVIDCYVTDNSTSSTATVGTVTLNANSLFVAVDGGAPASVAAAIWAKKPPGCNYNGSTVQTVQDPNPAYDGAGPSYSVSFTTASALAVNVAVSVPNSVHVPSNALALVTAAVTAAFAGTDGLPRASRIARTVYSSRFYPGIVALGPWATNIIEILVGTGAPSAFSQTLNIDQISTVGTVTLTLV